jgi:flagellar motility protein MotE (MotC chaperone)
VTDEKQNPTPETNETPPPPAKASGGRILKYILFGVVGLALVVGVAYVTLMLTGDGSAPTAKEMGETVPDTTESAVTELTDDEILDSLLASETDPELARMLRENLAALDYQPEPSDFESESQEMSREDSVEAVNWIEQEKKRLAAWESELDSRRKELKRLDAEVSQKVLKLEQAESARITNLARLYDGMDARAVARLMANLDDETVVSILPRMKSKNASQVLQLLPSQRAASLSKRMITIAEK